jgi:hypothetical protein
LMPSRNSSSSVKIWTNELSEENSKRHWQTNFIYHLFITMCKNSLLKTAVTGGETVAKSETCGRNCDMCTIRRSTQVTQITTPREPFLDLANQWISNALDALLKKRNT